MTWIDIAIFSNLFFNGYVFFKQPFELYLTYLPIILLLPLFILKYRFPRELLFILLPLLVTGALNVLLDNNTFFTFFKIFANITVNLTFYRYVMEYYEFDIKRIFQIYMKCAFFVACLGLIQLGSYWVGFIPGYDWHSWINLNKWGVNPGGLGIRINSLYGEPSGFGEGMSPAFFISVYSFLRPASDFVSRTRAIVIAGTFLLSFSSVAFLGVALTILLLAFNFGVVRYILIALPVGVILYFFAYNNAKEFRARVDGLEALFVRDILNKGVPRNETKTGKVLRIRAILKQMHGSSFVLYNNYHVTVQNFKKNPLFGSGLGSHEIAFEQYNLSDIIGGLYDFNTKDANSMLLRTVSELGLMGIIILYLFVVKFYVSKNLLFEEKDEFWMMSNALLVIILLQLFRQGNYTFCGFFIYIWMYYFNRLAYEKYQVGEMFFDGSGKKINAL